MIELLKIDNVSGDSFTFNDVNNIAPTTEFTTEVDDRFTERNKSQQHGIYPANHYWGKRLFHITGDLLAPDAPTYITRRLAMVKAVMPKPQLGYKRLGTLSILLSGMAETLTSEVTLDGYPELPMQALSPGRTSYQVNLKSFDPRLYGSNQAANLQYGVSDNLGGKTYNKTYNYTYGASSGLGPSSQYANNGGNIETYPTITFYGPITNPRITMLRSDGKSYFFTLTGLTLADVSDYAVADLGARTVVRGTGANLYNYAVGSDWFSLEPLPLTQQLLLSGSAGSSPAYAAVSWRNAYMI